MRAVKETLKSKRTWGILLYGVAGALRAAGLNPAWVDGVESVAEVLMAAGVIHAGVKAKREVS